MKDGNGSWMGRFRGPGAATRRPHLEHAEDIAGAGPAGVPEPRPHDDLRHRIGSTALAFRGYDVTNLGRSRELLDHDEYGPIVGALLSEASAIASETLRESIDLAAYIRAGAATRLEDFPKDVATIVAMELAQLRVLETCFDVPVRSARLSFGYSIGELAAMVLGGSFRLEELLPVPLALATDCASLAADTTMGILFTRAPVLPEADVMRLCAAVSGEGHGLVAPSAFLSPNTVLLLGQKRTIDRVEALMKEYLPAKAMLRRNPNRWPPLHTPLVRCRNIPNRAAIALYAIAGERPLPRPPVISCATGKFCDDALTCRETLVKWTERPQRLWDAIDATLTSGVGTVIHVGPAPNLVPATFARLSNNVNKHLGNRYLRGIVSSMHRHSWIASMLPHRAALLRAPFLEHIILEDWLLDGPVDAANRARVQAAGASST
jgi:[acyl-carrier-protein] S-malonyltransferase